MEFLGRDDNCRESRLAGRDTKPRSFCPKTLLATPLRARRGFLVQPFAHHLLNGLAQLHCGQVGFAHPSHLADVGSRSGFAGDWPAEIVDQHVVILGPSVAVGEDAVEDVQHFSRLDDEAGLFERLAADAVAESLAQLQHSARDRPLAQERLGGTTHQKRAASLDDDRADSNDGMVGIATSHCVKKSAGLNPTSFQPLGPSLISKRIWVLRCTPSWVSSTGVAAMSISAMANP